MTTREITPLFLADHMQHCLDVAGDVSGLIDAMTRQYGRELTESAYHLFCSRLPGLDEAARLEHDSKADVYQQRGGDIARWYAGSWRFYCTLAAWPYSPAARNGRSLIG